MNHKGGFKIKKIKNVLILGLMLVCGLTMTACGGEDTPTTTAPVDYPYMSYFENKVLATQKGTTPVAEENMTMMTSGTKPFNDVVYNDILFTAKPNTHVLSATFSVKADKDCKVELYLRGVENENKTYPTSCFIDINDEYKLVELKAGQTYTFTIETKRKLYGEILNVGKYTANNKCFDFELGLYIFKKESFGTNVFYTFADDKAVYEETNVKISNVSFNVEPMN